MSATIETKKNLKELDDRLPCPPRQSRHLHNACEIDGDGNEYQACERRGSATLHGEKALPFRKLQHGVGDHITKQLDHEDGMWGVKTRIPSVESRVIW